METNTAPDGLGEDSAEAEVRRAEARAAANLAADTLGHDLLEALVDELKVAPDCWQKMSERQQNETIERLRGRVRALVVGALDVLFRGEYPACRATLGAVTFKDGIRATLDIHKSAHSRHELADSVGSEVLIVIADPEAYLGRLDDVRAAASQLEMFTPETDTDTDPAPFETDPARIAPSTHPDDLYRALLAVGVEVDRDDLELWQDRQLTVAAEWAEAEASARVGGPPAGPRPHWLPLPMTETA